MSYMYIYIYIFFRKIYKFLCLYYLEILSYLLFKIKKFLKRLKFDFKICNLNNMNSTRPIPI